MDYEPVTSQVPVNFTDFSIDLVKNIALEHGYSYTEKELAGSTTKNLYENPRTDGKQIHKLSFVVENLPCEYYTAWYLPISGMSNGLDKRNASTTSDPRMNIQVFSITLPYLVEDLYVQSKMNINLGSIMGISMPFKPSSKVRLEGSFNNFFNVFTPKNEELNAFLILAPNIMIKMIIEGSNYDFEFSDNKIYFYRTPSYVRADTIGITKHEYNAMLDFGLSTAKQLARAGRPSKRIETQNIAMWQLYNVSEGIKSLVVKLVIAILLLTMPLLWPVAIYIVIRVLHRRSVLKKLQRDLSHDSASKIIVRS